MTDRKALRILSRLNIQRERPTNIPFQRQIGNHSY